MNCSAFVTNLDALLVTFDNHILNGDEKKRTVESFIDDFKTLTTKVCIAYVLEEINVLSVIWQKRSDVVKTTFEIQHMIASMKSYYDDATYALFNKQ